MAELKAVTFDCYGTLVDWEGGLGTFLYDLARRAGDRDPGPGRELRERWEEIQFELIQGGYRSYQDILVDSLRTWVGERGYRWNEGEGDALERAMQSWQPFPDTVPALLQVKAAGLRLAIVSNTDRHIIEHTLRQLAPVQFDEVVVAEDVRAYKPGMEPFTRALQVLSHPAADVLHVAFGFEYDIAAAQRKGMRTGWVNRDRGQAPGREEPDHEWDTLWGLAELVERPQA
ncbi:MAG TPA: haloacid dehalogenase type II [Thermoleophilaceae bacterium]|nr:haloacid dehalogenase type II [Thermoleophilaceae bacterium]